MTQPHARRRRKPLSIAQQVDWARRWFKCGRTVDVEASTMAEACPILDSEEKPPAEVEISKPVNVVGPRRRRTGVGMVSLSPVMQPSISEDEEELGEDRAEDLVNNNSVPNPEGSGNINESPTTSAAKLSMAKVRKLSDVTFHKFVDRLRRKSEPSAPFGFFPAQTADAMASSYQPLSSSTAHLWESATGILKHPHSSGEMNLPPRHRKSVSFSQHDHVKVIEAIGHKLNFDPSLDEDDPDEMGDHSASQKSLIPTFVYPCKNPNFGAVCRENVVKLESLSISEDYCILGNIRVNLTKLKLKHVDNGGKKTEKITVGVTYSVDNWETTHQSFAMPVRTRRMKGIEDLETLSLKFVLDCHGLDVGENIQFVVFCIDKSTSLENEEHVTYEDDNDKQLYQVACSPKLNPWAAKAAKELANFTPTVKFNKNYF